MSNYPPGVTGNELRIAGPDWDGDIERECPRCEQWVLVYASSFRGVLSWECPLCGNYEDEEEEEGPDPDAAYEAWREREFDRQED